MMMAELPRRRFIDGRQVDLDTDFNPWTDYPEDGTDPPKLPAASKEAPRRSRRSSKYGLEFLVVGEARIFYPEGNDDIERLRSCLWSAVWFWRKNKGLEFRTSVEGKGVMVKRVS